MQLARFLVEAVVLGKQSPNRLVRGVPHLAQLVL